MKTKPNKQLSLAAKKAYFSKVKKANYKASLRLEGFKDCDAETLPKAVILAKYTKNSDG